MLCSAKARRMRTEESSETPWTVECEEHRQSSLCSELALARSEHYTRSRALGTLQEVIATVDGSHSPSFDSLELRDTATEAPAATGFI